MSRVELNKSNKNKKIIIICLGIIVLLFGIFFLTHNSSKASQDDINTVDKMSIKDVAALTIVYSHLKYKNSAWDSLYKNSDRKINLEKHAVYRFKKYTVQAKKSGSYVYVVNKQAVFLLTDKRNSQAKVIIGDSKAQLGEEATVKMYKYVKDHDALSKYHKVANSIFMNNGSIGTGQQAIEKKNDSEEKSQSQSDEKDDYSKEELALMFAINQLTTGSSIQEKINYVKQNSDIATAENPFEYILMSVKASPDMGENAYTVATNLSTSHYWLIKFNGDNISGESHSGGTTGHGATITKQDLIKLFGKHKSEIDALISQANYNEAHITDLMKQAQNNSSSDEDSNDDEDENEDE